MNNNPLVAVRLDKAKFPRLSSYTKENAVPLLMNIIAKGYAYRGYRAEEDNVKFLASALYDEMMLDDHHLGMQTLTMYDIAYVVKKAVMGEDEFFFSVSSLYNILKKFCLGEGHDALEEARKIVRDRQRLQSSVQPMLDTYTGAMLTTIKSR